MKHLLSFPLTSWWPPEVRLREIITRHARPELTEDEFVSELQKHVLEVRVYNVWNSAFYTLSTGPDKALQAVFDLMDAQIDYVIKNWKDSVTTGLCQALLINSLLSSGIGVILNFDEIIEKVSAERVSSATCGKLTKDELIDFPERKNNHAFALILFFCKFGFTKDQLSTLKEEDIFNSVEPQKLAFSTKVIQTLLSEENIEHELVLADLKTLSLLGCVVVTPPSEGVHRNGSFGSALDMLQDDYERQPTPKTTITIPKSSSLTDFTQAAQATLSSLKEEGFEML